MRVIAGKLRGRHLKSVPKDYKSVRPISGRIKKSLFDILFHLVPGSRFMDVFAGTGAVGMEALSRGAAFVFFLDMDRKCVDVITENIERGGFKDRAKAHAGNALSELNWIPFRAGVDKFDIVFLGPPYKDVERKPLTLSKPALERLAGSGLLADKALVICQHHVKEDVPELEGLPRFRRERYGDTYLDFFRWK